MKTKTPRRHLRIAASLSILFLTALAAAHAAASPHGVSGEELAVWHATAGVVARENSERPYRQWFFRSDFTAATFIASAMDDPDREEFCGLSGPDSQAMIAQLKVVNAQPILLDSKTADAAGFRLVREKNPVFRYFALSRVVFSPAGDSAWLAVELNGERGSIVRLDKVDGEWQKTSRCGGWYMPE